ncbi:polyamine aminopropyltransferase [Proteiniclasticum sp.]|uniref:polyamine aminopropyltransferase n=1 Tax=Proteiniclasticum sp. TaxID=2053595 RepID=UPI00289E8E47|nr:polyamine aminopropyltransferase [Proteiniclasticum sp.]
MELWYTEDHSKEAKFSIKVEQQLYSGKSDFQRIDVFQSNEFGKFFTLDGLVMITEKDEFIYHDMIVHVPMATNPNIKKVLVIGAGDGGTVRELVRYKSIEKIDMVEIDKLVVDVCREYFPNSTSGLDDERVSLYFQDGLKFVSEKENEYDLIIVDSTDPIGPGEGLFTREFYSNCHRALTKDGILVNQHESPFYEEYAKAMQRAHKRIHEFFPVAKVYQVHIPTYASGHWLFGFASKSFDPVRDLNDEKWNALGLETGYYNTEIHKAAFALPNYVKKLLEDAVK